MDNESVWQLAGVVVSLLGAGIGAAVALRRPKLALAGFVAGLSVVLAAWLSLAYRDAHRSARIGSEGPWILSSAEPTPSVSRTGTPSPPPSGDRYGTTDTPSLPPRSNAPPVIRSVTANPNAVHPLECGEGTSTTISAVVDDTDDPPAGLRVFYLWEIGDDKGDGRLSYSAATGRYTGFFKGVPKQDAGTTIAFTVQIGANDSLTPGQGNAAKRQTLVLTLKNYCP